MHQPQDTRLNYGKHALLLSKRDFGMWSVHVWTYAADGNTHLNPKFKDIDLGIHASFVAAKEVGVGWLRRTLAYRDPA